MHYMTFLVEVIYNITIMIVMYVSLCGLSPVGCNQYHYSENEPTVAGTIKFYCSEPEAQQRLRKTPGFKSFLI